MSAADKINSKLHRNWERGALGLSFLQEGLHPFTDRVDKAEHERIVSRLTQCTMPHSKGHMKDCQMYQRIASIHHFKRPSLISNCHAWYTDHWQFAKCFMTTTTKESNNTAAETEASGLLSIIINAKFFQSELQCNIDPHTNTNYSRVRNIRNEILHNATQELTDNEVTQYLESMIKLLEDKKTLCLDPAAQAAAKKLKEILKDEVSITLSEEYKVIQVVQTELEAIKERIRSLEVQKENFTAEINAVKQYIEPEKQRLEDGYVDQEKKIAEMKRRLSELENQVGEENKERAKLKDSRIKLLMRINQLEKEQGVVKEDLRETKLKVERVDNKTMTNAPKWSRDLTKLLNPKAENDWRLLAKRLMYNNDDIRAWAQQSDPCMALLSKWYATHKTSEANFGILTQLQEMNRLDGAKILENAMKATEYVVEDEEFKYPSPPPIFLSYQWAIQNKVKLLKQHLNKAGYECWMDDGQMGGGDILFENIDSGIRDAKVIICCTTEKYAQSPNCNKEVNLSNTLGKRIIPLLMEDMAWPPKGSMGPIFSPLLYIRFFKRRDEETDDQRYWPISEFQNLLVKINSIEVPDPKLIKAGQQSKEKVESDREESEQSENPGSG